MSVDVTRLSSVDIRNAALATPLTKDGRARMGNVYHYSYPEVDEFLDNCYVDADFISQDNLVEAVNAGGGLTPTEDYDHFASRKDSQKKYKYLIKRRSEKAQKENFEKDLLGANMADPDHRSHSTIYIIEGPAGSGKTTYAHHLLQRKFHVDICDVETATQQSCSCFSKVFDFPNKHFNPITSVEMLLLSQIHLKLAKGPDESNDAYIIRLSEICHIYFGQLNSSRIVAKDSPVFRAFFEALNSFCVEHKDYEKMSSVIYEQILGYVNSSEDSINRRDPLELIEAIQFLLGVLMRVYYCLSRIYGEKYVLFLDNIERYIISETGKPYVAVYDIELQKILNSFYYIADQTEDFLYKSIDQLTKIDSSVQTLTSFGILIAVRESTLSLLKSNHAFTEYFEQHHSENVPTYVNISNWFDYYEIYKKKIRFFLGIDNEQSNLYTQTFNNILHDISMSKWSLRGLLLNLFNNNYRRLFANLTEVFCNYEDVIKYYNLKWDTAKGSSPYAQRIRHLCRKLIIRIVLDYMQTVNNPEKQYGFFDGLMARCDKIKPSPEEIARATYARRIITYLDNVDSKTQKPVPLPELVKVILHRPMIRNINRSNVALNDRRIDDIASILETASQTAKIHTNGVELVALNLETTRFKGDGLSGIIKEEWNKYRTAGRVDKDTFNIRITPAGSALAMLFSCFEYFACRYKTNSIPLFMLKSESDRRKLLFGIDHSDDSLLEDELGIYDRAMNCIDIELKYETRFLAYTPVKKENAATASYAKPEWLFDYDRAGTGMVHALRIICDHLGYLQDYREFLATVNDDSYENAHYKEDDGKGVIDEAIRKYKKKYFQISKDYKAYLELGNIPSGHLLHYEENGT